MAVQEGDYPQALWSAQDVVTCYATILHEPNGWEFRVMGEAALGLGDLRMVQTCSHQSLQKPQKIQRLGFSLLTLVMVAGLLAKRGDSERSFELLALVVSHRASWQMAEDQAAPLVAELKVKLPPEIVDAALERGRSRDLEPTI